VARDPQGNALGCGALRPLEPGAAEVKRMFIRPEARGRGLSRLLLERLEGEALERGIAVIRLETCTLQPEARSLYESAGYEPIPCYGRYRDAPHSRCYERRLD
jgi:GNAT superfamily N-acetyltransferase